MPLFEYACKSCAREFEVLVRASETPECPSCHGKDLERRLSVFAAHTAGAPQRSASPGRLRQGFGAQGPCGSCGDPRGPGACSIH